MILNRREALRTLGLVVCGCARPAAPPLPDVHSRFAALEERSAGRLGVAAVDAGTGWRIGRREGERFPLCSTFKLPLVAAVLRRVDAGQESLSRVIPYDAGALLEYAPVTREHVAQGGLSVEQLCEASVSLSDNTAANLLLETLGGPAGLTAFFRSLGDETSRLDRNEPTLNTALPADERDTTTPAAMVALLSRILVASSTLSDASRARLVDWLVRSPTGRTRLRAGLPRGWRAGDKTGTGENGATNDVAIAWPPGRAPLLICAYSIGSLQSGDQRAETLAEVARIVTSARSAAG
ncbi:MAG: class A beta-lactamase [Myxococcales bacterium]|nr:MAG: class A beta-lactamase [Myxococcales bacterium]